MNALMRDHLLWRLWIKGHTYSSNKAIGNTVDSTLLFCRLLLTVLLLCTNYKLLATCVTPILPANHSPHDLNPAFITRKLRSRVCQEVLKIM